MIKIIYYKNEYGYRINCIRSIFVMVKPIINIFTGGINMSKLYPDCDYFNDERDSEFAPDDGECESCYRYEICSAAKKSTETHMKVYTPRKDSIIVIETYSDNLSHT